MKETAIILAILAAIVWSAVITRALTPRSVERTIVFVPAKDRTPMTICRGVDDVIEMPEVTITARPAARRPVLRRFTRWTPEAI